MRRLTRPGDDSGAAATLIAILLVTGVLFGTAALTVDVGQLYAERRQVQNGADSAALAVALACARNATSCDTSTGGAAASLANANANDGATAVQEICGSGHPSLAGCAAQAGPALTQCPPAPSGVEGWVRARTSTLTSGGSTLLPPSFAQTLAGGYTGTQVQACAQVAWGSPSQVSGTLPVTFSKCEWDAATAGGGGYAPAPPYTSYPTTYERALKLHSTNLDVGSCPAGPAYSDLPGGFGWLDGGGSCTVTVVDGVAAADPGVSASTCKNDLAPLVGHLVYIPIYSDAWGNGSGGRYRIDGFAAFFLTGYWLPGASPNKVPSIAGSGNLCNGSDKCIYGWFTEAIVPGNPTGPGGAGYGAKVIRMVG